jgi:hypothetical protein
MKRSRKLTRKKARTILHHVKVRGRRLTAAQRRFFGARASGYPVRNLPKGAKVIRWLHPDGSIVDTGVRPKGFVLRQRKNPTRGTVIYGRVLKIFAQKTSGPYKGQRFVHTFKRGAIMVGMPDGSLRIVHP